MAAREIRIEFIGDSSSAQKAMRDTEESSRDLGSTFDKLQGSVESMAGSFEQLNRKMDPDSAGVVDIDDAFGNLERTMLGVSDILGVLEEQFGLPLGPAKEWSQAAADVGGGLEGIIAGGRALVQQIAPLLASMGGAIAATWAYVAALVAQAAAFIAANAPIILLVAGLAALAAGVLLVIKHWDTITEKVPILQTALDGVVGFFNGTLLPAIKAIWEKGLQPVIDFVTDNWPIVASLILLPFAPLILLATDAFGVRSALTGAFEKVLDFLRDTWTTVKEKVSGPFEAIIDSAKGVWGVTGAITGAFDTVLEAAKGGFGIPGAVEGAFNGMVSKITGILNGLIDAYNNTLGRVPGSPNIPRIGGGSSPTSTSVTGYDPNDRQSAGGGADPGDRARSGGSSYPAGGVPGLDYQLIEENSMERRSPFTTDGPASGGQYAGGGQWVVDDPGDVRVGEYLEGYGYRTANGWAQSLAAIGSDAGPGAQHRTVGGVVVNQTFQIQTLNARDAAEAEMAAGDVGFLAALRTAGVR